MAYKARPPPSDGKVQESSHRELVPDTRVIMVLIFYLLLKFLDILHDGGIGAISLSPATSMTLMGRG